MAITVKSLFETLEEMKTIYPFQDEKTLLNLGRSMERCEGSLVEIQTTDDKTGIKVALAKDASWERRAKFESGRMVSNE